MFKAMWILKHTLHDQLNVGFVDIYDDGELLKETFDIEVTPSVRFMSKGVIYHYNWPDYKQTTSEDLINFVESDHKSKTKKSDRRRRVQDGPELYFEYVAKYLADNHFDEGLPLFLQAKNWVRDNLDYEYDFK